jgi:signal transduction histidine kinase
MQQPNVLVISDHPDFPQSLMSRWHSERTVPAFTVMNSVVYTAHAGRSCELIIVGPVDEKLFASLVNELLSATQPVIAVVPEHANGTPRGPRIMTLRQQEGWIDTLMLLAAECLRRVEMTQRAQRAEETSNELGAQATLGRYMLEMRHGINNALTSILGNAELLLMQPGEFSEEVRDQLTTIRSMSLRLNEIVARFSSLEAELMFAKKEPKGQAASYVSSRPSGLTSF